MSHINEIREHNVEIRDLDALAHASALLGLELVRGQRTYRWYGQSVGDSPLPAGFPVEDLGRCEHAIRIPGNPSAYEIGVVTRRDGRPGYALLWDSWQGGYGLAKKIGARGETLLQAYGVQAILRSAQRHGHRVKGQTLLEDGSVVLRIGLGSVGASGGAFGWKS